MGKIWKKFGTLITALFFVVIIALICLLGYFTITKYNNQIAARDAQISTLETSLTEIGELTTGYVVNSNVRAGEIITADLLTEVTVPTKLSLNLITSIDAAESQYFKINLSEGTVLTVEDVVKEKVDNTQRSFDIIVDETPIGLKVGDYVDFRITLPLGEDFIAISHKKIEEINSGIPKITVNEGELITYNSLLLDKVLYPGTKLYAIAYKEAGAQVAAETFYPINQNLQELIAIDPGLLTAVKQEMVMKRSQIEQQLGGVKDKTESEYDALVRSIEQARLSMNQSLTQSQRELERRIEAEQRAAASGGSGGGAAPSEGVTTW